MTPTTPRSHRRFRWSVRFRGSHHRSGVAHVMIVRQP